MLAGLVETHAAIGIQIGEPGNHSTHEGALLLAFLKLIDGLHDRNATATTGKQHRPLGVCTVFEDTPRIHFEIGQRDHVFGEFDSHSDFKTCKWGLV